MDNDIYEVTNFDDVEIKHYEVSEPVQRCAKLEYGYLISVSKQVVKGKLKPGQIWPEYPMLKCMLRIYEPHKWWEFWKWRKLIGYQMMYIGD